MDGGGGVSLVMCRKKGHLKVGHILPVIMTQYPTSTARSMLLNLSVKLMYIFIYAEPCCRVYC